MPPPPLPSPDKIKPTAEIPYLDVLIATLLKIFDTQTAAQGRHQRGWDIRDHLNTFNSMYSFCVLHFEQAQNLCRSCELHKGRDIQIVYFSICLELLKISNHKLCWKGKETIGNIW